MTFTVYYRKIYQNWRGSYTEKWRIDLKGRNLSYSNAMRRSDELDEELKKEKGKWVVKVEEAKG